MTLGSSRSFSGGVTVRVGLFTFFFVGLVEFADSASPVFIYIYIYIHIYSHFLRDASFEMFSQTLIATVFFAVGKNFHWSKNFNRA